MDPFKYREVQALFTARLPDSADSDQLPDRVPLNGYGTLRPNIRGTSVVFTEVGEFAVPRTRQVAIVDGELLVEVIDGESSILQPLFLEVTVDERANQQWSWTLTFDSLTIGEWGEDISHPALSFPVEEGDGPLELSTVATTVTRTANFVTRGAPGAGITGITASNGIVTVEWDGGNNVEIPIPTATLATPTNDGLMPATKMAALEPVVAGEDDQWRVMDSQGAVALAVTESGGVRAGGAESRASEVPYRVMDASNRVAFEVDAQGRTHIYDQASGGAGVTELHAFIASGQSNMSGRGDPISDELDTPDPRIMQYGANRRVLETATVPLDMHDTPIGLSPATVFAREYLRDKPSSVGVLLIPAAHGGTGFTWGETSDKRTWTSGTAIDPEHALYEKSVVQAQEALSAAEASGYAVSLRGVLWHQGEANGGVATATYSQYFDALAADYRADMGDADLPIVVGQMMPEGMEANASKYTVDKSHAETPARLLRSGFAVAPSDTARFNDLAHFSRDGVVELGKSFHRAYQQAVLNVARGRPLRAVNLRAIRHGSTVSATWDAPLCRVTSYRVEFRVGEGAWAEVVREWPMYPYETFDAPEGPVWVRVTALEGAAEAAPTLPEPAIGA